MGGDSALRITENIMADATHLLLVPHTHWDREWYLTFQQFRMRLVATVDKALNLLETDPNFSYFMLDGQTVVLDDYLEIRPENEERLKRLAREGRLLVGPWYIQPDEFLVGGEALVRNLQLGDRMAEPYGGAMPIGYVPDTFGHIAQLPQILRGFGIDNAMYWRGVPPEVTSAPFNWRAPDGSVVTVVWLHDDFGYSNAARLPMDVEALTARINSIVTRMRGKSLVDTLLLMNGTDHMEPQEGLPEVLAQSVERLREHGLDITIGTLPQYLNIIAEARPPLQTYTGEMRSSYFSHLLPGVLSTRMWLKQRNAAGESLLTHWAEPMAAWADLFGAPHPTAFIRLAWKLLLQNQPHDSICGCSIDTVHREMIPRYEQSEQIAQEVTKRALSTITAEVNTQGPDNSVPVVVYNPTSGPRTDVVRVDAQLPFSTFVVADTDGRLVPYQRLAVHGAQLFDQEVDKALVLAGIGMATEGRAMGYVLMDARLSMSERPGIALVELVISEHGAPDMALLERSKAKAFELASREDVTHFRVIAREAKHTDLLLLAHDVPAVGGRTLFIRPRPEAQSSPTFADAECARADGGSIENALLRVTIDPDDGTFSLVDKRTGARYVGLNRVVDGGDVGDLYTYCPPSNDTIVERPSAPPKVHIVEGGPAKATIRITRHYQLPAECAEGRNARSSETVDYQVISDVSLAAGSQRVEIRTEVENSARDHRLRVLFPTPFVAHHSDAEGVFEVTRRPAHLPRPTPETAADWAELPVDTQPQKRFVDLSDQERGLAILNRGLPEYEVVSTADGGSALALTLLRCVEWLSREDLATRRGHAGPMLNTPEAQGIGRHVFEYAVVPHAGNWRAEDALPLRQAQEFEEPMRAVVTEQHDGALGNVWSFVHVAPASLVVSAVKRSERGDGLIVRVYNPQSAPVRAEMILARPFSDVSLVNLNEEPVEQDNASNLARNLSTGVHVDVQGGQIVTLLFRMTA